MGGLRVTLLASRLPASGNLTTCERIASHLLAESNKFPGLEVSEVDTNDAAAVRSALMGRPDVVIGIHLFRAGQFIVEASQLQAEKRSDPIVVLILGGTDVNEHVRDPEKRAIMDDALELACEVVALHEDQVHEFSKISGWEKYREKVCLIRPSVIVHSHSGDVRSSALRETLALPPPPAQLFTMVCGLRPIKNPLFLTRNFCEWHSRVCKSSDEIVPILVLVGAEYGGELGDYAQTVRQSVSSENECVACPQTCVCRRTNGASSPVILLPAIRQALLHELMQDSAAVVSSSDAEGLPNALLEAMLLGTPVIARKSVGNTSVVRHGETGLLFSTPQEFEQCATELLLGSSTGMRQKLTDSARSFVEEAFGFERERLEFQALLSRCISEVSGAQST